MYPLVIAFIELYPKIKKQARMSYFRLSDDRLIKWIRKLKAFYRADLMICQTALFLCVSAIPIRWALMVDIMVNIMADIMDMQGDITGLQLMQARVDTTLIHTVVIMATTMLDCRINMWIITQIVHHIDLLTCIPVVMRATWLATAANIMAMDSTVLVIIIFLIS